VVRIPRRAAVIVVLAACALAACSDDDSAATPTTQAVVTRTTAIPRADSSVPLTSYLAEVDGFTYGTVDDDPLLAVFGDLVGSANASELFDRFAARVVRTRDGDDLAVMMVAGLQPGVTDVALTRALEAEMSSRFVEEEQVFVGSVDTQTAAGTGVRFLWVDGRTVVALHGNDLAAIEAYLGALIDQRRS
jgi:hypothetical protein